MTLEWRQAIVREAAERNEFPEKNCEFIISIINAIEAGDPFLLVVASLEDTFSSDPESDKLLNLLDVSTSWIRSNIKALKLDSEET